MSETQATAEGNTSPAGAYLRRWLLQPEAPALIFLVLLVVGFSVTTESFLSIGNLEAILTSVAVLGIIAMAVNQVILAGEIDISTGSMMGLCAMIAGIVSANYGGLLLPLLAAVAVGIVAGAVNGLLVTLGRVPAIIVTLGMLYALRGVILLITGGEWVSGIPGETRLLGVGTILGVSVPVIILLVVFGVLALVSRDTIWGRNVYAVGGNRPAARLVGLPVDWTRFSTFVLVGACVGLSAMIFIGRTGGVQTNAGQGLELQVIAAVVIGGTSIAGGRGSTLAALVGAVLIGTILNGMILVGIPGIWQDGVLGALILLAITGDVLRRRVLGGES